VIPYTGTDGEKRCTKCKRMLPFSFYRPHWKNPGLHPWCRNCRTAADREYRKTNPEKLAWKNLRQRAYMLGLDRDEVSTYSDSHDGRCDVCGGPPAVHRKRLDIEHDHATGAFRGMTCGDCNNIMKFANDDVERLVKVIAYLIDPPARHQPAFRLF
jgi:hypothetical protein